MADGRSFAGADGTTSFAEPGEHLVRVRVTDDDGATTIVRHTITVRAPDSPPPVVIDAGPAEPSTGQGIYLSVRTPGEYDWPSYYAWDLDGDGQFDDSDVSVASA